MLLLVAPLAAAPLVPPPGALPVGLAPREVFKHPFGGAPAPAPPSPPVPTGWDIGHYTLAVRIDPATRVVTGHATITATRIGPGDLVLHANGPEIGAVRVNGEAVTPSVADDELRVPIVGDEDVTVDVDWIYAQERPNGIQWSNDVIFSFHEPIGARTWLPVYDDPSDKATLTWEVTAPEGWVVAANGVFEGETPADTGWSTWRYTLDLPIATYLMTVHLSDYVSVVEPGDIPVYTWVYPGREADAEETFGDTAEMLAYFSALYAPYPFPSYGNAMAPFGGAMEHTTCVTFADDLVGEVGAPLVNVHELGHHWWGDDVTLADWADIWLNEGFATYTEALWYEHLYGQEGLTAYMAWVGDAYFEWQGLEGRFPLYDPLYMWGGVVYDKGAWVVHMLRGVLGDERFFAALSAYEAEFHLGNATTADLEAAFETSTGEDLAWFFDEWVYAVGEPTLSWGWAAEPDGQGGWQVDVEVEQDVEGFRMPVPFRFTTGGSVEDIRVEVVGGMTHVSMCLPAKPDSIELDPDGWVLRAGETSRAVSLVSPVCGAAPVAEPAACGCRSTDPRGLLAALAAMALLRPRRLRR